MPVYAQQPLSLQECIDLAIGRNLQHQRNEQTLAASRAELRIGASPCIASTWMPTSLHPPLQKVRDTQESVALATRVRDESTNFTYNGNLRMSRRLPYFGAIQVTTSGERRDFSSNRRNDFGFLWRYASDYEHDILNRASEEVGLQRAEHNFANARLNFEQQGLQLEGQVIDDYYTLVQRLRQLEIQKAAPRSFARQLELAQRKFEVGLIAEVEALRLQVELLQAESSFAPSQTAIESQRDQLRQTLGLNPEDTLDISTEVENKLYAIDSQKAMRLGLQKRTDMRQTEISEKLRRLDLKTRTVATASMRRSTPILACADVATRSAISAARSNEISGEWASR